MIVLIQRVKNAQVLCRHKRESIGKGILVYIGFERGDDEEKLLKAEKKILNLRIFEDEQGKMNLSVLEVGGEIMIVPNFTLSANAKKGNRPSFDGSLEPSLAKNLYLALVERISQIVNVKSGCFGEHMFVSSENDGPVNIVLGL